MLHSHSKTKVRKVSIRLLLRLNFEQIDATLKVKFLSTTYYKYLDLKQWIQYVLVLQDIKWFGTVYLS